MAWNDTAADYPQDLCIHQLFEAQVERTPEAVAVVCEDQQLTYRELNTRANQLVHYLQTLGVEPETLVGICLERSIDMVIGLLSILKAGGAYLPLDPAYPAARLAFMLEDAQVPVLLTRSDLKEKLPETRMQIVCLDIEAETLSRLNAENLITEVKSENLAYVIYTSGTTGIPKGVLIEHGGVANLVNWQADIFKMTKQSRIAQLFSYTFDGAVGETFMALLNGATLVMLTSDHIELRKLIGSINNYGITITVLVPSLIQQLEPNLLQHRKITVVSVGESCPVKLAAKWMPNCRLLSSPARL